MVHTVCMYVVSIYVYIQYVCMYVVSIYLYIQIVVSILYILYTALYVISNGRVWMFYSGFGELHNNTTRVLSSSAPSLLISHIRNIGGNLFLQFAKILTKSIMADFILVVGPRLIIARCMIFPTF